HFIFFQTSLPARGQPLRRIRRHHLNVVYFVLVTGLVAWEVKNPELTALGLAQKVLIRNDFKPVFTGHERYTIPFDTGGWLKSRIVWRRDKAQDERALPGYVDPGGAPAD